MPIKIYFVLGTTLKVRTRGPNNLCKQAVITVELLLHNWYFKIIKIFVIHLILPVNNIIASSEPRTVDLNTLSVHTTL